MGFLDNISKKAVEAAEAAKRVASQTIDTASKTMREVSGKALASYSEFSEKASKELSELSKKAYAEGAELGGKVAEGWSSLSENVSVSTEELSAWAASMPDKLKKLADDFDAEALWNKISKTAAKAGQELIVMVLTIYYAVESKIPGLKSSK